MLPDKYISLIHKSFELEKYPLARLISIFEDERESVIPIKQQIYKYIQEEKNHTHSTTHYNKKGVILGWTGMPGVGKSSLLNSICLDLMQSHPHLSIAVLAIDPSSHVSGGSILGDRTRIKFPTKKNNIFFRSQPTEMALGGLGRATFSATRLLREFFDILFIETVGVGQNETEIKALADHVFLILQPLSGDEIQFIKSGIMEIPDNFIINKSDQLQLAKATLYKLKNVVSLISKQTPNKKEVENPIFLTSATDNMGIQELSTYIYTISNQIQPNHSRNEYFLKKYIQELYGQFGLSILEKYKFQYNHSISYDHNLQDILKYINLYISK